METLYKKTIEKFNTYYHKDTIDIERGDRNRLIINVSKFNGKSVYYLIDSTNEDKDVYLKEYGNILCELTLNRQTLVVKKGEDKVSIGYYWYHKIRKVGKKYFAKRYNREYLTYNLKTNNLYVTNVTKVFGGRSVKRVRVNNFSMVNNFNDGSFITGKDRHEFTKVFFNSIDPNFVPNKDFNLRENLILLFVQKNSIKGPNRIIPYILNLYPGKKFLKKNNNNVIPSILDALDLKTKFFISLMNNYQPDVYFLIKYSNMLGLKHIKNIDKKFFADERLPYFSYTKLVSWDKHQVPISYQSLTDYDRKNIVKVINDFTNNRFSDGMVNMTRDRNITGLIEDHIKMIHDLKKHENDIKFRSTTYQQFQEEHRVLTEKINLYRNSEEIFYVYGEDMVNGINHKYNGCEFRLLDNEYDYVNESAYQSNCVRTYIDKITSIIVSARRDKERVTMEFNYHGDCIQKRGRFNGPIPENMESDIVYIEQVMDKFHNLGLLVKPKIKIYNKIHKTHKILNPDEFKDYNRNNGFDLAEFIDEGLDQILF